MAQPGPPYLFDGENQDPCFTVTCDMDAGLIEMVVRGRLSQRLGTDVYTGMLKCLAEHPSAIIVDLRELTDPYGAGAAMWLAVNRAAAALQPPVRLALVIAPAAPLAGRLRRLGAAHFFPVFATAEQARSALAGPVPLTDRLLLGCLPPEPGSVGQVRELVSTACTAWDQLELLEPSRAIMTALATNAVRHARTDFGAAVWRRGPGLHLSVYDRDPRLPHLLVGSAGGPGHGLWTVDVRSTAWGAMATRDGKMVWATLGGRHRGPRWPRPDRRPAYPADE